MLFSRLLSTCFLLVCFFTHCADPKPAGSVLFFGGSILTMTEAEKPQAVLVKEGKVVATGKLKELRKKAAGIEEVNLKGKTLTPGFIAAHTHPDLTAYLNSFVDLSGFTHKKPKQVWRALKKAVKTAEPGQWIFCKGFDPMLVPGLKAPSIKKLDKIAPDNPVLILAQSLHSAWANSKAFEKREVTADTPDPGANSYFEKGKDGKLTGFISEVEAIKLMSGEVLDNINIKDDVVATLDDYLQNGFTTIATLGLFGDGKSLMLFEHLAADEPKWYTPLLAWFGIIPERRHTPRHFLYVRSDATDMLPDSPKNGDDFFRIQGVKMWYDGSPYTGSMLLKKPYKKSKLMQDGLKVKPGHTGKSVMKKAAFAEQVRELATAGWQLAVHSQGDRAGTEAMQVLTSLPDKLQHRHRLEHLLLFPAKQYKKMRKHKLAPSFHINHIYYYGDDLSANILGKKRAEKVLAVKAAAEAGTKFSLHEDAPMYPVAPFSLMQTAVNRKSRTQKTILGKENGISVEQALFALTKHAAWQIHMDGKLGTIEEGKYADLVILDRNPLETDAGKLDQVKVKATYLNGVKVH